MRILLLSILFLSGFVRAHESAHYEVRTFKGQIVSVQKFNLVTKPAPYVQFLLAVDGEEYTVDVGPEWYTHAQGILFVPREEIEVQAFVIEEGQRKILLAIKVRQDGRELKLRDVKGEPLWGVES